MENRKILIYGAGGAGKELAFSLSSDSEKTGWKVSGFVDDTKGFIGKLINGIQVVGNYHYLKTYTGHIAVTMLDYPVRRKDLILKIEIENKITFPNLSHSTSLISPYSAIAEGVIINHHNFIGPDVKLGRFVFINSRTGVGHDAVIGDFTTIYSGINIGGGAQIGSCCLIGSGTTVLPKVKIGNGSIIGGGAMVVSDIPEGVMAAGVPAKVIKQID